MVTDDEVSRCLETLREKRSLDDVIELSKRLLRRAVARKLIEEQARREAEREFQEAAERARGRVYCHCGCGEAIPLEMFDGKGKAHRRYLDTSHRNRAHYVRNAKQPMAAGGRR
jgi:hypothetical protein